MKRRPVSAFSLSFLDIMFCGFGAVVLLVLILNHDTVEARNETFTDLRTEVIERQQGVLRGNQQLTTSRDRLAAADASLQASRAQTAQLRQVMRTQQNAIAEFSQSTQAKRADVDKLSAELKRLENEKNQLNSDALKQPEAGQNIRQHTGDGDRQYLTGLKVGGKRILILLDSSASMLDETIINVIRRRNMPTEQKRRAPKWQRSLATLDWLLSQLPADARFQVYTFNTRATAVVDRQAGQWLKAANNNDVGAVVTAVQNIEPAGGTSLYHAFAAAKTLSPRPDNILLITDGLPTQGRQAPRATTVSADRRLQHFVAASQTLPRGIPVNTILLPMEGDAWAAAVYWKLAIDTRGSFMTPARDWP